MSFSSRLLLLIVVTMGCLIALVTYLAPYDPRLPWMADMNTELESGKVSGVWLLPGCLLGLWADLPAAIWFGGCLLGWLWGAWAAGRYALKPELVDKVLNGDGLAGWPVLILLLFYVVFFLARREERRI